MKKIPIPEFSNNFKVIQTSKHREMVRKFTEDLSLGKINVAKDPWAINLIAKFIIIEEKDRSFKYSSSIYKSDYKRWNIRILDGAIIRIGAYISSGVVIMPHTFVNIGASIGKNSMIDTGATIGSGAQIGANVHISGKVSIGGVLEPRQKKPVIVEDNCFIGALSSLAEGAHVGRGSVLAVGTVLNSGIKVFDVRSGEAKELNKGFIPPNVLAVPANYQGVGGLSYHCVSIIKDLKTETQRKTAINPMLRKK